MVWSCPVRLRPGARRETLVGVPKPQGCVMSRLFALVLAPIALAGCESANQRQVMSEAEVTCQAQAGPPGSPAHEQCLAVLRQKQADEIRDFRVLTDRLTR
jgi:hypothetical protein